jgi:hypothetical protein
MDYSNKWGCKMKFNNGDWVVMTDEKIKQVKEEILFFRNTTEKELKKKYQQPQKFIRYDPVNEDLILIETTLNAARSVSIKDFRLATEQEIKKLKIKTLFKK